MATNDVSRTGGRHKKKDVSVFFAELNYDELATSADVYQLGVLPNESVITSAFIVTVTAADAATASTVDIGFAGGAEILNDSDLKASAGTVDASSLVPLVRATGGIITATPTITGTNTQGKAYLVIEYVEYEQCTGEMTDFASYAAP